MSANDKPAVCAVLVMLAVLAISQAFACRAHAAQPALVPGDHCQDVDGRRVPWTSEARKRTRERVDAVLERVQVSQLIRAYHRVIVCRESFCGEASVRHRLGEDRDGRPENGLGAYGLSLRWQAGKWGDDADPGFCTPEASALVAHEIMWRAVTRFGARNLVEIQAVYSGAVTCSDDGCRFRLAASRRRGLCSRLSAYGVDCSAPVTENDLGQRLTLKERREVALSLARAYLARWLGRGSITLSATRR
jgi:hypothetical protein